MIYDIDKALVKSMRVHSHSKVRTKLKRIVKRKGYKNKGHSRVKNSKEILKFRLSDNQYMNWKMKLVKAALFRRKNPCLFPDGWDSVLSKLGNDMEKDSSNLWDKICGLNPMFVDLMCRRSFIGRHIDEGMNLNSGFVGQSPNDIVIAQLLGDGITWGW